MGQLTVGLLLMAICWQATALPADTELRAFAEKARQFLCQKSLCPKSTINIKFQDGLRHVAYFHREKNEIWLSPELSSGEIQIAIVHELMHAVRFQANKNEALWLDEGLAKFMEYKYSGVWPKTYSQRLKASPYFVLSNDEALYQPGEMGYPSSFWFVTYLYNRFGQDELLKRLANSQRSGWDNIISAIFSLMDDNRLQIPLTLVTKAAILRHFAMAMWVNNPYIARYSLFFIDAEFEPLVNVSPLPAVPPRLDSQSDGVILFSAHSNLIPFMETYVLRTALPLSPERAMPLMPSDTFLYLSY
jgi:hypothetical protein